MNKHNFELVNYDTDSITICNKDHSFFSEEQKVNLIIELNSLFDENIIWEDDGYYETIVVIRAKNYILQQDGKIKIKGSGLKGSTKSPGVQEFTHRVIDSIVEITDKDLMYESLKSIYNEYVNEILDVKDIKRFASRKTLSSTMQASERLNETRVIDALKGSNYTEGDRMYMFYLPNDSLCLAENFKGDYNKARLLKNLFDTISIFDTILPVKELFLNYSLKKNQKLLGIL